MKAGSRFEDVVPIELDEIHHSCSFCILDVCGKVKKITGDVIARGDGRSNSLDDLLCDMRYSWSHGEKPVVDVGIQQRFGEPFPLDT